MTILRKDLVLPDRHQDPGKISIYLVLIKHFISNGFKDSKNAIIFKQNFPIIKT
jgi:hypothetical protein